MLPAAFLLAEWKETRAYRPLARLCRLGEGSLEDVFGDAGAGHSHKVMAAVYDGDPQPIYDIIVDRHADQMARCRMFDTLVMLVADGRLDHEAAAAFVRECFDKLMPRDESMVWLGWVEAVALLGMAELGPRVRKAIDNFWVPAGLMEFEDFEQQLHYAKHHSYAPWRNDADFAPFGDAVDELARYVYEPAHEEDALRVGNVDDPLLDEYDLPDLEPLVNPYRGIGRNDPCPCGSGKKYKKCCLPKHQLQTDLGFDAD